MVSPMNGAAPVMFFVPEFWERFDCELEAYPGLWIEMRANLRNFERQDIIRARYGGPLGANKACELAAPHIRDWNLYERGEDGQPVRVAPPSEQGIAAFNRLDPALVGWVLDTLQGAYKGGKDLSGSPTTSGDAPAPGTGSSAAEPPATKRPSSPRSRRPSSSPKPSTTAA